MKYYLLNKNNISLIIFLLFTAVNSNFTVAQTNIDYYINTAYSNNPNLKATGNLIHINKLEASRINSELSSPKISLTSDILFAPYFNNNGKLISTNPGPNAIGYDAGITNGGLYSALLNVEKNVFNGSTIDAYKNETTLNIKNNKNDLKLLKHTIKKNVIDQYLNSYYLQKNYKLAKETTALLKKQLEITKSLMLKGLAKQSDYLLLKVEVEKSKIKINESLNNFKNGLYKLNTTCGIKDTFLVALNEPMLNVTGKKITSEFLKQYKIDSMLVANKQNIFEAKYNPQIKLFFDTGLNAVETNNIQRKFGLSAGIHFSLPIYDGNQKNITQQQSSISLENIEEYKKNRAILIYNNRKAAESGIELYKTNLQKIRDQVKNYDQVVNLSQMQLDKGQISMVEYLTILKGFLQLKIDETITSINYQQSINQYNFWNW